MHLYYEGSEAWREQQRRSSENVAAAKGLRKKER
jgi:hypothetical protein